MTPAHVPQPLDRLAQRQKAIAVQQAKFLTKNGKPRLSSAQKAANITRFYSQTSTNPSLQTWGSTGTTSMWITGGTTSTVTTATGSYADAYNETYIDYNSLAIAALNAGTVKIAPGTKLECKLPDGSAISVKEDGSYEIKDIDAKIVYKANRLREFNTYINVSDRLGEFVKYCGEQNVTQDEMMDLPIKLFIGWIVLQAAKADREPEPDIPLLEDFRKMQEPVCLHCAKEIKLSYRKRKIEFCTPECFETYYEKIETEELISDLDITSLPVKQIPHHITL